MQKSTYGRSTHRSLSLTLPAFFKPKYLITEFDIKYLQSYFSLLGACVVGDVLLVSLFSAAANNQCRPHVGNDIFISCFSSSHWKGKEGTPLHKYDVTSWCCCICFSRRAMGKVSVILNLQFFSFIFAFSWNNEVKLYHSSV